MFRAKQPKQAPSDLVTELHRLGENVSKLVKVAWESEERMSLRSELRAHLRHYHKPFKGALDHSHIDQKVQKARAALDDAWKTAHGPQIIDEMNKGLVDSLKRLNDELSRCADVKPAQEVRAVDDAGANQSSL